LQGTPGLPDLIMVRWPEILFWETKREVGEKLSADQERWQDHLENIARISTDCMCAWPPIHPIIEYRIIRPSDREWAVARLSQARR
jgi:hypothetical protein